jgi:hypothetical protein
MTSLEENLIVIHGWNSDQFSGVSAGSVHRSDFSLLKADAIPAVTVARNRRFMSHLGSA